MRLGDYVNIRTGKLDANASSENGQYPFFTCSVTPLKIDTYSYDCECVLVAGNGDLNVKYYNGKFDAYQRTYIIESKNKEMLLVPYLYCFLDKYVETLRKQAIGGVIKYIKLGNLTDAKINIPTIEEQKSVVSVLDKVNAIIDNRKKQLIKLDELVKSRFVEMFGDPVSNPKKWNVCRIREFADVRIGPFGSLLHKEDYIQGGHPLVNPSHMINGKIVPDNDLTLSESKYKELGVYKLKPNDIVIARRGEIGRCALVESEGFFCGTGSMFVRIIKDCRADYLQRVISYPTFAARLEDAAVGITMKNINVGMIENCLVPLPPLALQREFAAFVEKVDKLEFKAKASLEKLETLKKAMMQKYFN